MKKKLMFLALGVVGLFASSNAQPGFPTFNLLGVFVNGVQVNNNQAIPMNSVITFSGLTFAIRPTPAPNNQIPIAENIVQAFFNYNVVVDGNMNGVNNTNGAVGMPGTIGNGDFFFGTSINDFTIVAVPFDLGTVSILAAGAFIAFVTARRRRNQMGLIA